MSRVCLFGFLVATVLVLGACARAPAAPPTPLPFTLSTGITQDGRDILPVAYSGEPYQAKMTVSGPKPPYTCVLAPGSTLPPGLALADCSIVGTAPVITSSEAGFPFQFIVVDGAGRRSHPIEQLIRVIQKLVFTVSSRLPDARVGEPYTFSFASPTNPKGGNPPYTFATGTGTSARIPFGLTMTSDGVLQGTPQRPTPFGPVSFDVCAVDSSRFERCGETSLNVLPAPTPTPRPTPTPIAMPTRTPSPTPPPQLESLTYKGTFTMNATTGDWIDVGFNDEKATANLSFPFEITLKRAYRGGPLTGEVKVNGTWTGEWASRSNGAVSKCRPSSGSLSGAGVFTISGSFDPDKPEQVRIDVDAPPFGEQYSTENRQGFPKECETWLTSSANLLWSAFFDCKDKRSCNFFKASGDSLSFSAGGNQLGVVARLYLHSSGRYNGTAQLTLVSEVRR